MFFSKIVVCTNSLFFLKILCPQQNSIRDLLHEKIHIYNFFLTREAKLYRYRNRKTTLISKSILFDKASILSH